MQFIHSLGNLKICPWNKTDHQKVSYFNPITSVCLFCYIYIYGFVLRYYATNLLLTDTILTSLNSALWNMISLLYVSTESRISRQPSFYVIKSKVKTYDPYVCALAIYVFALDINICICMYTCPYAHTHIWVWVRSYLKSMNNS